MSFATKSDFKQTERFEQALLYAAQLHAGQVRKRSGVPYIAHLLSVAALVLQAGGGEDEAIAALLHDAVEDQGGLQTLEEIERHFGSRVASIVEGCTDSYLTPKPPWRVRKEAYLLRLEMANREVILVSLADKLHNARSILIDLRREGGCVWERFNGGKDGTLWYYRSLLDIFHDSGEFSCMVEEFRRVVNEIVILANQ